MIPPFLVEWVYVHCHQNPLKSPWHLVQPWSHRALGTEKMILSRLFGCRCSRKQKYLQKLSDTAALSDSSGFAKGMGKNMSISVKAFFFQSLSKLLGMAGLCSWTPCIKIIQIKLDGCGRIRWNSVSLPIALATKSASLNFHVFFPKNPSFGREIWIYSVHLPNPECGFFLAFQLWSRLNPEIFGQA